MTIQIPHLAHIASDVFISALVLMLLPFIPLIYYLISRFGNIDGNVAEVRGILLRIAVADLSFIAIATVVTILSSARRITESTEVSLIGIILVLVTLAVAYTHWWALFRVKKLVKKVNSEDK